MRYQRPFFFLLTLVLAHISSSASHLAATYEYDYGSNEMSAYDNKKIIKRVYEGKYDSGLQEIFLEIFFHRGPEVLKAFVDRGADINWVSQDGLTLLHYAAFKKDKMRIKFLLNRNANALVRDKKGRFPLNCLFITQNKSNLKAVEDIVDMLIIAGNDPSFIYEREDFAVHSAYTDCQNEKIITAMKEADKARRINLRNSPGQLEFWQLLQTTHIKNKKDILVGKYQQQQDPKFKQQSKFLQYHSRISLTDQLKTTSEVSKEIKELGIKKTKTKFQPIFVGPYCLALARFKRQTKESIEYDKVATFNTFTYTIYDCNKKILLKDLRPQEIEQLFNLLIDNETQGESTDYFNLPL